MEVALWKNTSECANLTPNRTTSFLLGDYLSHNSQITNNQDTDSDSYSMSGGTATLILNITLSSSTSGSGTGFWYWDNALDSCKSGFDISITKQTGGDGGGGGCFIGTTAYGSLR